MTNTAWIPVISPALRSRAFFCLFARFCSVGSVDRNTECCIICIYHINGLYSGGMRIRTSNAETPGYVYCEQLRIVDLNTRQFSRTGFIPLQELMDIMDAIQSIFDYV